MATKRRDTLVPIAVHNQTKAVIELPVTAGKGNSPLGTKMIRLMPERVHDISDEDIPLAEWNKVANNRSLASYVGQGLVVVHTGEDAAPAPEAA